MVNEKHPFVVTESSYFYSQYSESGEISERVVVDRRNLIPLEQSEIIRSLIKSTSAAKDRARPAIILFIIRPSSSLNGNYTS